MQLIESTYMPVSSQIVIAGHGSNEPASDVHTTKTSGVVQCSSYANWGSDAAAVSKPQTHNFLRDASHLTAQNKLINKPSKRSKSNHTCSGTRTHYKTPPMQLLTYVPCRVAGETPRSSCDCTLRFDQASEESRPCPTFESSHPRRRNAVSPTCASADVGLPCCLPSCRVAQ